MRILRFLVFSISAAFALAAGALAPGAVDLRCEYLYNPLGVDTPSPRLSWRLNASAEAETKAQTAYRIIVSRSEDSIAAGQGEVWDSGKVMSSSQAHIRYGGEVLEPSSKYFWAVKIWDENGSEGEWSKPAFWVTGLDEWNASWIGAEPDTALASYLEYVRLHNADSDFDRQRWASPPALPSPHLRKVFAIDGPVRHAYLHATSIGTYEVWVNGQSPDTRLHAPEISDYDISLQYQTYDLSHLLQPGNNVLAATLADGWALGRNAGVKWMQKFPHRGFYATDRRLLAQLMIEYEDGRSDTICSDASWLISDVDVPVREADHFGGQTIDARFGSSLWTEPAFCDSTWKKVYVEPEMPQRRIEAQRNEPVRVHTVLSPQKIWRHNGRIIVDFGQNIAGHCLLRVKGTPGRCITLRHGEWLDDDGSVYTRSLGYAAATDRIILSGSDDCFEPASTYHGFQYVEIDGWDGEFTADMIEAKAISSDTRRTGYFECSNPALNKLFENVLWTQRNNMISILHDNPSRDERTGAAGDIQIFAQTAIFNMDIAAFLSKYMDDFTHMARNGQFFSMIPSLSRSGMWDGWIGAPAWSEAGLIVPWRLYENYADTCVLAKMYPYMKSHVEAIRRENPDYIWRVRHNHNGDWLNANTISNPPDSTYSTRDGATPDDLFATAFYARAADILTDVAAVLGHDSDYRAYTALSDSIRHHFAANFVRDDGYVHGNSQGAYSIALAFGLVPEHLRPQAYSRLVSSIEAYDNRLSTGFISTPLMMQLLAENGDAQLAYTLLESTRFPSWLYNVENGASTVWERWDAWVPGRGFQNNTMNSFDHVAFGSVAEWMYRNILGINPDSDAPGYEHFTLRPLPGGSLSWAKGAYESIRGTIESAWTILPDGATEYRFTVPPGSSASLVLQASSTESVSGGDGVFSDAGDGTVRTVIGPGQHCFRVRRN